MPINNNTIRHENEKLIANVNDTSIGRVSACRLQKTHTTLRILLQFPTIFRTILIESIYATHKYVVQRLKI